MLHTNSSIPAPDFFVFGMFAQNLVGNRFLAAVCFLYKTNPNRRKIICGGKATFSLFFGPLKSRRKYWPINRLLIGY